MMKNPNRSGYFIPAFYIGLVAFLMFSSHCQAQIGGVSREQAVRNLIDSFWHTDSAVREQAVLVAAKFREPSVVEPLIRVALNDSDRYIRERAIWALGLIGDPRAVIALTGIAKNEDATLGQRAIEALGKIGSPASVEVLAELALHAENPTIRYLALDELLSMGNMDHFSAFREELANSEPEVRENAAVALARTKDPRFAEDFIDLMQNDSEASIRNLAAEFLGEIGARKAVDALVSALEDESPDVRMSALEALLEINDPKVAGPVAKLLQDGNPDVRRLAIWTLGGLNASEFVPQLADVLQSGPSAERKTAVEAMAGMNVPEVLGPLVRSALYEQEEDIRGEAARAVVRKQSSEATNLLLKGLTDKDPAVRRIATDILGMRIDKDAVKPLVDAALADPEPIVRQRAAKALGTVDAAGAIALLEGALENEKNSIRIRAVEALENIRSLKAVESLIRALGNDDAAVRARAASALAVIGTPRAVGPLVECLRDADPAVKDSAANSLASITGQGFGQQYEKWEHWWESHQKKGMPF